MQTDFRPPKEHSKRHTDCQYVTRHFRNVQGAVDTEVRRDLIIRLLQLELDGQILIEWKSFTATQQCKVEVSAVIGTRKDPSVSHLKGFNVRCHCSAKHMI